MLAFLSRHVLAHLNFSLAGNVLLAWMGLFLPFAWQDLGREFLGSLKLLVATTEEA